MPACVEEAPGQKRKRKGATKLQDFHQWYLATCAWACRAGAGTGAGLGRALPTRPYSRADADHADSSRRRRKGPSFAGEAGTLHVL